ncbi:hypothetical protein BCY86_01210 [Pajaroellobacter abortibovis]|uniref:Uncharacterized protein n=1 Tax=Pajaroellobacter abortibovis TaxID=1882918 RepID=A0A1L6MVE0_9BACT|nr:hypothetical protein BCY86_01210 [Pajaroellobacter abortibovis]
MQSPPFPGSPAVEGEEQSSPIIIIRMALLQRMVLLQRTIWSMEGGMDLMLLLLILVLLYKMATLSLKMRFNLVRSLWIHEFSITCQVMTL